MIFTDEQIVKILVSHIRETIYSPQKTSNAMMILRTMEEGMQCSEVKKLKEFNFIDDIKRIISMLEYAKKI
jgi:hypothetical protein